MAMRSASRRFQVFFILFAVTLPALAQIARLVPAPPLHLPGIADSNSPSHWTGNKFIQFNSDGMPIRSEGANLRGLARTRATRFYTYEHAPLWIEATYKAPDGTLYAWYHHEVFLHCPGNPVSEPVIGALRSEDDGLTFFDLGIILTANAKPDCETRNRYFGGGTGDFSAIPDRSGKYLYFFYSNYAGPTEAQGIATARIAITQLNEPVGQVTKYFNGRWNQPGLGGQETPIFPARSSWASGQTDAFWGPSIHWNTHLDRYVIVMNYTCCASDWPASGIYVSFAPDLNDPLHWQPPVKLLDGGGWYPMVTGTGQRETDKLAGRRARFFLGSDSNWWIEFDWQ